jgi:hypothetical protein
MPDITYQKIKRWADAEATLIRHKKQVSASEVELTNANNDLGKFLMPDDAKDGEVFSIWYGDSLITVQKDGGPRLDYKITVRQRGKAIAELGL